MIFLKQTHTRKMGEGKKFHFTPSPDITLSLNSRVCLFFCCRHPALTKKDYRVIPYSVDTKLCFSF